MDTIFFLSVIPVWWGHFQSSSKPQPGLQVLRLQNTELNSRWDKIKLPLIIHFLIMELSRSFGLRAIEGGWEKACCQNL